jgi:hypothetical protein
MKYGFADHTYIELSLTGKAKKFNFEAGQYVFMSIYYFTPSFPETFLDLREKELLKDNQRKIYQQ